MLFWASNNYILIHNESLHWKVKHFKIGRIQSLWKIKNLLICYLDKLGLSLISMELTVCMEHRLYGWCVGLRLISVTGTYRTKRNMPMTADTHKNNAWNPAYMNSDPGTTRKSELGSAVNTNATLKPPRSWIENKQHSTRIYHLNEL